MERQYKNLGYFLIVLVAFVAVGFYKPYFALIPNFDPRITPLVQIHAILLMTFVALLVAQPLLIRYKQRGLCVGVLRRMRSRCRTDCVDPVRPAQSSQLSPIYVGAAAIRAVARRIRRLGEAGGTDLESRRRYQPTGGNG
jgi:hypothetical protein